MREEDLAVSELKKLVNCRTSVNDGLCTNVPVAELIASISSPVSRAKSVELPVLKDSIGMYCTLKLQYTNIMY